jgi:NRPS condensation-like uncharacterized protein
MAQAIYDWVSDPANSNAVRTLVAVLAIPGAIWGTWLFAQWVRGRGLDARIDEIRNIVTTRIEKEDGSYVSFKESEINELIIAMRHKKYAIPNAPELTLEYICLNALGLLIGMHHEGRDNHSAHRFMSSLGNKFQKTPQKSSTGGQYKI